MKQILVFVVALCFLGGVEGWAQSSLVSIAPAGQRIDVDSSTSVKVRVEDAQQLHAYSVQLTYDPQILRCVRVVNSRFLGTLTFFSRQIDSLDGMIRIDEAVLGPGGSTGSGNLLEIQFKGLRVGSVSLAFQSVDLRDTSNQKVSTTSQGGTIQVSPTTAVTERGFPDTRVILWQNYPNPFNPSTTVRYQLANDGLTHVRVYSFLGEEVMNVYEGYQQRGEHSVTWTGHDNAGRAVPTGVYVMRIETRGASATTRMLLIR